MSKNDLPKLTPRQEAFAHARISGATVTDAMRQARPNHRLSPNALRVEASRLEANPKVRAYVEAALAETRKEKLLTRDTKRQILGEIAQDKRAPKSTRIMAVKVDNDMTGDTKIRFEGEVTLGVIFSALAAAVELPTNQERKTLKLVEPIALPDQAAAPVVSLQTAMEKAGG